MVKRNLSLTELVSQGEFYLSDVNADATREILLRLINEFRLDLVYELMKETAEWEEWSRISENIKIHYEECPKKAFEMVEFKPRIYLRNWADDAKTRVAVLKKI